jgi:hypothetical protein
MPAIELRRTGSFGGNEPAKFPVVAGPDTSRSVDQYAFRLSVGWQERHLQTECIADQWTVVAATSSEHLLFCDAVAAHGVASSHAVEASFRKLIWLFAAV